MGRATWNLTKRFRRFVGLLVRHEVQRELARLRRRIEIDHVDPLRVLNENRSAIHDQLAVATNFVGDNVAVGRRVILWGGVAPGAVGLRIHDDVRIYDDCKLVIDQASAESGIVLKSRVAMNFGCYIDGSGGVEIGEGTILGPYVAIFSSSHRIDPHVAIQSSGKQYQKVVIGKDVWIGAHAVIRAGVSIGDGSVIGAGSIVTRDVPPATVAAGNPARLIRSVEN